MKNVWAAKTISLLFIQLFFTGIVLCQSVIRFPFSKKFSVDDGLSSYNIKKIIQDKYGFIWVVTQDGLNRYDGKSFILYNKAAEAGYQLLESDVWDIEEDTAKDFMWVATAYGGINAINLKTGKVCVELRTIEKEGINNNWLRCLKLNKNNLWIGTYNGLAIYNTNTKTFEKFDAPPFVLQQKDNFCIDKIVIDKYQHAWLFIANYGLVLYNCSTRKVISSYPLQKLGLAYQPTYRQFQTVVFLQNGSLLVATNQGFRRLAASADGSVTVGHGLYDGDTNFDKTFIKALNADAGQDIWFSADAALYKYDTRRKIVQQIKDANTGIENDWLSNIYDIYFDKSNNIWLGTQRGVAFTKNAVPAFTSYSISDNQATKIGHALYLYPFNDSIVYACTETGLLKVNVATNTIAHADNGKAYYFMAAHKDKTLLVSNQEGFFTYNAANNTMHTVAATYAELQPIHAMTVNSINYTGDSLAIIGTENGDGFYAWNYTKKSLKKILYGSNSRDTATQIVNTCYTDSQHNVWVLGDKLITIYNPQTGSIKNVVLSSPVTNIPYTLYFDVCEANGFYYVAVYGAGILQLDKEMTIKKIFTEKDGLSNAGVYKIFPVADSLLFITTNKGLSVLNTSGHYFSNYYQQDGLHSNAFEEGCGIYSKGKIYAGGLNGFTIINPAHVTTNKIAPSLYLSHIKLELQNGSIDTSNVLLTQLDIPSGVLQATVYFSAINFSAPLRTTYAYKIKELNNNWIDLGTQNSVSIMGLQPGKYTLLIKAANENNVWSVEPLQISLQYLPKWYQTLLFKILVGLAIAGLLYSFYNYRISQLKKQQKIRRDISADLHDDIGSILEGVKIFTHLAKKEPHKPEHLNNIEESLLHATTGFRDIIWILDDKEDTVYQFMERVKKLTLPVTNANNITLECSLEPGINENRLTKAEKRHLLMIVKESINNCIKYAECTTIQVSVAQLNSKAAISIEDNGKGFTLNALSDGNGHKNILHRAQEIGYKATIISSPGNGCKVTVFKA